ncbi:Tol-Pal system-associated acyl-CoA thioesterase [hydrothermal vent metagenome]|uniref:Tol-Pal system-associated acyl-CoA thioesterase n=1 Tax=hydrothermal vent metagenome TaxID=652676 RepID=A0A3B1B5C8_9ZZZZ
MRNNESTFLWPVQIYYEDTDAGGVVYYANYLKFMERARTEWLRSLGLEQDELIARESVIFAVRSVQVDYLRPARFNDALTVSAEVVEQGRASLIFKQVIRKNNDDTILCQGRIKIASLDCNSFKPRPLPMPLMAEFSNGE